MCAIGIGADREMGCEGGQKLVTRVRLGATGRHLQFADKPVSEFHMVGNCPFLMLALYI